MWALRAQTDKLEYSTVMRRVLEGTPNLFMREGMAVDLDIGPNDEVTLTIGCTCQSMIQLQTTPTCPCQPAVAHSHGAVLVLSSGILWATMFIDSLSTVSSHLLSKQA